MDKKQNKATLKYQKEAMILMIIFTIGRSVPQLFFLALAASVVGSIIKAKAT